jgi:predicted ABC-type exoprotein transport system permease subunit
MNTVLLVLILVLLFGAFHYSPAIGPYPAGGLGIVLIVLIVLLILVLMGRI